jgi:hypothetical protein
MQVIFVDPEEYEIRLDDLIAKDKKNWLKLSLPGTSSIYLRH